MNTPVVFRTDAGTLAVFDPACLDSHLNDPGDWWCGSFLGVQEVANGTVAFISTAADGTFMLRLTFSGLLPDERDYAAERIGPVGLKVVSGRIFAGKGECIPGGGIQPVPERLQPGDGQFIDLPPGEYDVIAYSVNWFDSPRWWTEDFTRRGDAPADFVLALTERRQPFPGVAEEPRFSGLGTSFLFESRSRQIGPTPGTIFSTEVWKNAKGLTLKAAGPCSYKPILHDFSSLAWRDKVKVRAKSVDHSKQTVEVEIIEKLGS